jgi:hypothetical protein
VSDSAGPSCCGCIGLLDDVTLWKAEETIEDDDNELVTKIELDDNDE